MGKMFIGFSPIYNPYSDYTLNLTISSGPHLCGEGVSATTAPTCCSTASSRSTPTSSPSAALSTTISTVSASTGEGSTRHFYSDYTPNRTLFHLVHISAWDNLTMSSELCILLDPLDDHFAGAAKPGNSTCQNILNSSRLTQCLHHGHPCLRLTFSAPLTFTSGLTFSPQDLFTQRPNFTFFCLSGEIFYG